MASWQRILFGKNEADTRKADSYRSTPTRRSSSLGLNPDGTSMPLSSRTNMQISGSEVENGISSLDAPRPTNAHAQSAMSVTDKPHTLGTQHRPNQPSPRGTYPVAKTPSSHGDQNNASDVETPTFHGTSRHSGTQIQVSKTPNPPHSQGFDVARSLARSGGFNDVQKITTERRSSASVSTYADGLDVNASNVYGSASNTGIQSPAFVNSALINSRQPDPQSNQTSKLPISVPYKARGGRSAADYLVDVLPVSSSDTPSSSDPRSKGLDSVSTKTNEKTTVSSGNHRMTTEMVNGDLSQPLNYIRASPIDSRAGRSSLQSESLVMDKHPMDKRSGTNAQPSDCVRGTTTGSQAEHPSPLPDPLVTDKRIMGKQSDTSAQPSDYVRGAPIGSQAEQPSLLPDPLVTDKRIMGKRSDTSAQPSDYVRGAPIGSQAEQPSLLPNSLVTDKRIMGKRSDTNAQPSDYVRGAPIGSQAEQPSPLPDPLVTDKRIMGKRSDTSAQPSDYVRGAPIGSQAEQPFPLPNSLVTDKRIMGKRSDTSAQPSDYMQGAPIDSQAEQLPSSLDSLAMANRSGTYVQRSTHAQSIPTGSQVEHSLPSEPLAFNNRPIATRSGTNAQPSVHMQAAATPQTEQLYTPSDAPVSSRRASSKRSGTSTQLSIPMQSPSNRSQAERSSESLVANKQSIAKRPYANAQPSDQLNDESQDSHSCMTDDGNRHSQVPATLNKAEMVGVDELATDDVIIAIMGPTGAGKSSFVSRATGAAGDGVGHTLTSHTSEIKATRYKIGGASVVLVDTPGFDDTKKSDLEILESIANWLGETYKEGALLSALLYFHRITDNRMAGTPLKNLRVFQRLCGNNAMSQIVLTTTMWDEVDEEVGMERLEELRGSYWKPMIAQGSTTFRYLNTQESAMELIVQLVAKKRREVRLQKEIANKHMELRETSAGQELHSRLDQLAASQMQILERLRTQLKEGPTEDLRKEFETVKAQLNDTMRQSEALKLNSMQRTLAFFRRKIGI